MIGNLILAVFYISEAGNEFLDGPTSVLLPQFKPAVPTEGPSNGEDKPDTMKRKGKGCHALPVVRELMAQRSNWFPIETSEDYHTPGVFKHPHPKRMGYCEDMTTLTNYEKTDPHFIFTDIQLSKGTARNVRTVEMNVAGEKEVLHYRIVPCAGVKQCKKYADGCGYVVPLREFQPCPDHPSDGLIRSGDCPVEFVYLWPQQQDDNRRWLTGFVRLNMSENDNLHNHPIPLPIKIPSKVDADIRRAVMNNPNLKTQDIMVGEGLPYMPGAASAAAAHKGKVKNIRLTTLRDVRQTKDSRGVILDFEKESTAYDKTMKEKVEGTQIVTYVLWVSLSETLKKGLIAM